MTETITFTADELARLAASAFEAAGVPADGATATARILVEGDMTGLRTHGVVRVPSYVDRLRKGGINAEARVRVERTAPALALVDGDNGLGPVVAEPALEMAMEMAGDAGIAYVGCRATNHFGAMVPYALDACQRGLVLMAGTNATPTMAPWGGAEARIGNNPICVAAPVPEGPHFILDMAMSVAARGKIRLADRDGRPIPEGWAVDVDGRPTADPKAALAGFLLPFGGHKGSGLSMAVDILSGVLSGAGFLTGISSWMDHPEAPQRIGHFFVVIDPARLIGAGAFADAMSRYRDILHATQPAEGIERVLLPGEREQQARAKALADGIGVAVDLVREIEALAVTAA